MDLKNRGLAMKEADLYPPLKRFLESQGYEVKGEIGDCDVMAVRGEEAPLIVELKLTLNLDVVLQAAQRLDISPSVYVGVPAGNKLLKRRRKSLLKLFRLTGMGLVVIDTTIDVGDIDVLLDPAPYQPRLAKKKQQRLLREFMRRQGDPNAGGSDKRGGLMTAYRQRALAIAHHLNEHGATKASQVAKCLGEPKARDILYRDVYGWFDRVDTGVGFYELSSKGSQEIMTWQ